MLLHECFVKYPGKTRMSTTSNTYVFVCEEILEKQVIGVLGRVHKK